MSLRYCPFSSHTFVRNIFSKLPNLRHLQLDIRGRPLINKADIVLSSLISLEVRWVGEQSIHDVLLLFGMFSLPNLQTLVLHYNFYRDRDFPILLQSLVRTRSQECPTVVLMSQ